MFDDAGRRTAVVDALGRISRYAYDENGNQLAFQDAKGRVTTFAYDDLNRRTATILPAAALDANGNGTIDAGEASVVTNMGTSYDEMGRRVSETDANGHTKRFVYDSLGRLNAVLDALGQCTKFGYDDLGNQLSQIDANTHTTSYVYDNAGRRTGRTLPGGQSEGMLYDAAGRVQQRTDFNGTVTQFGYDTVNRLLTRTSSAANAAASSVAFTYTLSGQRATMTDASGVTTYGYDSRDRLTTKATPQGTLGYSYDAVSNVTSIASSNANGTSVAYGHDELNRLSQVVENANQTTSYGYDEVGNLQSVVSANGLSHTYGYNALNRLTGLDVASPRGLLASYGYTQLRGGQRSGAQENFASVGVAAPLLRTLRYGYDALDRLRNETLSATAGPGGAVSYALDPVGNRQSRTSTIAGLTGQTFTYDTNDRLTTDGYDANGNTTAGHVGLNTQGAENGTRAVTDTYDSENRLISRTGSNTVQVVYDGDGNKVRETINGQTFSYLADERNPTGYAQVVEELQNGAVIRTYTYGHALLVQDQKDALGNWNATWYGYDGHGSVRLLTDALGNVTDRYDYDAFGELLHAEGTTFNRHRYCGEAYDEALGLYYLRARLMNPLTGRFWTADSYEGVNRDPGSLHKYLYANGNPVNAWDPSGRFSLTEVMISVAARVTVFAIRNPGLVGGFFATVAVINLVAFITSEQFRSDTIGAFGPTGAAQIIAADTYLIGRAGTYLFANLARIGASQGVAQTAFDQLSAFRRDLGMPAAGAAEDTGTLAKLEIGNTNFFGINAHGTKVGLRVNAISNTHAEIDALNQAFESGVKAEEAFLYVDRTPCQACDANGALRSIAKQMGLKRLVVGFPGGVIEYIIE